MAKRKVTWSFTARNDRKDILRYWKSRNKSVLYSRKLDTLFKAAVRQIMNFPEAAPLSDLEGVRVKPVKDYLILYEVAEDGAIFILRVWDSRRDPEMLKRFFT